jgi:hypothetical protein
MAFRATIEGDLARGLADESRQIARGLRRALVATAGNAQAALRQQARSGGFRDGGRAIANAWRVKVYPAQARDTLHPAALIYSKAPDIVSAFDAGKEITVRHAKYLCWPTGYNAVAGRRGGRLGLRITPQQMIGAESFVIRAKRDRTLRLWCLRTREGQRGRRRKSLAVVVRAGTYIATGHVKGRQQRMREILARGFVPMFFLTRSVNPGKRLDIDAVRNALPRQLVSATAQELRQ